MTNRAMTGSWPPAAPINARAGVAARDCDGGQEDPLLGEEDQRPAWAVAAATALALTAVAVAALLI
ncbi:hypothetical protein [Sabulicella rubraurantiaca]|uniref:hypothetical protein n=1 Tax=Sabulicella rubraurantiaca TaxID=2811429 RepID=UPI001A979E64|nr:hypothetical protein [Sabulicella rubraurantiaca]